MISLVFSLSGKMAENILIIKANMDKLLLAPSTYPDEDEIEFDDEEIDLK
jgi:hypothetical protein